MGLMMDSTLHIVDTKTHFFLTTQKLNLQINLTYEERQKVYQLLERLKKQEDLTDIISNSSQFEAKFIRLLMNKGIVMEQSGDEETTMAVPFSRLVAPDSFMSVIHRELGGAWTNDLATDEEQEWWAYIYGDYLYVTTSDNRYLLKQQPLLPIHHEHAAYVWLEQCPQLEPSELMDKVIRIDLSIYTNERKLLITSGLDEDNFVDSVWCDSNVTGHKLLIDVEAFFPLVRADYVLQGKEEQHVVTAFGFDQRDAIRNLIFLLHNNQEHTLINAEFSIQGKGEDTFELDQDSFLLKLLAIYFSEENITLNVKQDLKELVCEYDVMVADNRLYCANSLLFSLYYQKAVGGGGVLLHDHDIVRT